MINNVLMLFLQTAGITLTTCFCLRKDLVLAKVWLSLLSVCMNLFVLKQISFLGLNITCSDALAVGYLLGLNLIQEFFGKKEAIHTIWITCFSSLAFLALSLITLGYTPSCYDQSHVLFMQLLFPQFRIVVASLLTSLIVQFIDLKVFIKIRQATGSALLPVRTTLSLLAGQSLDTVLFSFLGLYGLVAHVGHVMAFSLLTKAALIFLSTPYLTFAKRIIREV